MTARIQPFQWLSRWLLLALAFLAASAAWAGPGDDGIWRIQHARYGTSDRNIDVTDRLKELASADRRFKVTNTLFGNDPAYGEAKMLRIYARGPRGDQRIFDYREGSWVDGNEFIGWGRGDWGDRDWHSGWDGRPGPGYQPPPPPRRPEMRGVFIERATYGAGRQRTDVTDRVREMTRGGPVDLHVSNDLVRRDPAYGELKTLRVYYRIGRGPERIAEANEGERLRIDP